MEARVVRGAVAGELSRRQFIQRAGVRGAGALIAGALPTAARMVLPATARADVALQDGTLQAFYDTLIPGRPSVSTDLGHEIHPKAIAGVEPDPGAVEADALLLGQDPRLGFTALVVPFGTELEGFAALEGGDFLSLPYDEREAVCLRGLDFSNPTRAVWEAAAAVAFTAFCAAATQVSPTSETASGYEVMGHPGVAPEGYRDFSYGRALSREATKKGYLP